MYFYVIQLFDFSYKEDIILALISAGIERGTYVEGRNIDNILNTEFPIFTGFFKTREEKERVSSLFFGMVEKKERITSVLDVLKQAGIENDDREIFRIIIIECEEIT